LKALLHDRRLLFRPRDEVIDKTAAFVALHMSLSGHQSFVRL